MLYQWGRLLWWLNQNASAIEALSAIVTSFATVVLVLITRRYSSITERLAYIAGREVRSQAQPSMDVRYEFTAPNHFRVTVENTGSQAAQLISVTMSYPSPEHFDKEYRINIGPRRIPVMQAHATLVYESVLPVEHLRNLPDERLAHEVTVYVQCSDLTGLGIHTFEYTRQFGMQYTFGSAGSAYLNEPLLVDKPHI
jgi:hypothetical protein